MSTFRKMLSLLQPEERRRGYLLLAMLMVMALFETVGVASVMPFIAVLANPAVVQSNAVLASAYRATGFQTTDSFLFALGIAVFVILLTSIAFKALTTGVLLRYTHRRSHGLSSRVVAGYLARPYPWFLDRHSADLLRASLSEVDQVITGVLTPMLQLIAHAAVVTFLVCLLIAIDPQLALLVAVVLGGIYGAMFLGVQRYLARIGTRRFEANSERHRAAHEAFSGIKEVKIGGLEGVFADRFREPSLRFTRYRTAAELIALLPRFVLEAVAFGGLLLVVLYLMSASRGLQQVLPILAVYSFAAFRIIPAMQQVYASLTLMRYTAPTLDDLHRDLASITPLAPAAPERTALRLAASLELRNVTFSYPNAERVSLHGVSVEIPAHSTVGLVGATGSGKTTTVDLILGLFEPDAGELLVDGVPVTAANVRAWQLSLGYVPQNIFLADASVAANIAFGVPPGDIDRAAVERAARAANLHDFVVAEMPAGYDSMVGERGVRLSGGQRQRIGIARALYRDPDVLVLDEATSALDTVTEQTVMEAVRNLSGRKTIILIAHRLSTVRECDRIYLLEHGRIESFGTYDELVRQSTRFRAMATGAQQ